MTDGALHQLLASVTAPALPTLAVFDENAAPLPPNPFATVAAITNRSDICRAAEQQHWPCSFSDFVLDPAVLHGVQQCVYRISKEKRVVEHVLQALWDLLPVGGVLHIAGYKQEGIKTFAERARASWNCAVSLERGRQQLHLYHFHKQGTGTAVLNSDDYHALRPIGNLADRTVYSKPGVFAWDRFDDGSCFLLEHLPQVLAGADCRRLSALDLGCGYGLLALALVAAGFGRVVATDNNAAALVACTRNLKQDEADRNIAVVAGDCGDSLKERFDLLLCNPPFHRGFTVAEDLTGRFLAAARRLLRPGGRALFVVNGFIPLEQKAAGNFAGIRTVAQNRSYRLVLLSV